MTDRIPSHTETPESSSPAKPPLGGWGPALTLLAFAVSAGAIFVIWDTIAEAWKSLPDLRSQPEYKAKVVAVVLVCGIALYRLKHSKLQVLYGFAELIVAMLGAMGAASAMANRASAVAIMIALFGSVYIAVRGYENLAAGMAGLSAAR